MQNKGLFRMSLSKRILKLDKYQKYTGIFIDKENSKIYIDIDDVPEDFTGEFKAWFFNGQLSTYLQIKHGKKDGEKKEFTSKGQLVLHCFYQNDLLEGKYTYWNIREGFNDKHETIYKNGRKVEEIKDTI